MRNPPLFLNDERRCLSLSLCLASVILPLKSDDTTSISNDVPQLAEMSVIFWRNEDRR